MSRRFPQSSYLIKDTHDEIQAPSGRCMTLSVNAERRSKRLHAQSIEDGKSHGSVEIPTLATKSDVKVLVLREPTSGMSNHSHLFVVKRAGIDTIESFY